MLRLEDCFDREIEYKNKNIILYRVLSKKEDDKEDIYDYFFLEKKFNFEYPDENNYSNFITNNKPENSDNDFYYFTEAIDPCNGKRKKQYIYEITEYIINITDISSILLQKYLVILEMKLNKFQLESVNVKEYFTTQNLKKINKIKLNNTIICQIFSNVINISDKNNFRFFIKQIKYYNISKPFIKELLLSRKEIENNKLFDIKAFLIIGNYL